MHTHPPQRDLVRGWEAVDTAQRCCLGPPWNGRELVVFPRHLLSNVLSGRAMLTLWQQVPPCNKRLCVLRRWPRGGGGPARGGGGKGNKLLLYRELACPGASSPPKHMPFLALEGVKGLLESKTSRCPTVPDTPPKPLPAFFFPFCNKSVISHGTEEPAACL